MKRYDAQHYLIRGTVSVLVGLGACLLIAALWLPKGQEPSGWMPLQTELSAVLAARNEPEMSPEPLRPSAARPQIAVGVTDGGAAGNTGNAQSAENTGSAGNAGRAVDNGNAENTENTENTESTGNTNHTRNADRSLIENDAFLHHMQDGRIDLNGASAEQLVTLPGIGPAKAQAIIDDRDKNGPFRSIEEITRVRGIGTNIFEKMKDSIVVGR
ncbi:ComEA family DNA-binding protein [Paenibacillus tarimensis]